MAGDWIKMRSDLFTHPKVVRMASALKADTLRTVGGLMSAWCLFDAHSDDGTLDGYTAAALDDHLRWPGFSDAMQAVEWLIECHDEAGESLALPRFDTHNGQSAKRRAQDADRKKSVRKMSATEVDKKRTREEKRREEIRAVVGSTSTSAEISQGADDSGARSETETISPGSTTDAQASGAVQAAITLRKLGMRIQPQDPTLLALIAEQFTVGELALTAAEKALKDAQLWNDPDVHPELHELLASAATQQQMRLTAAQHTAVRAAAVTVGIGWIASTLRGRRRDAQNHAGGKPGTASKPKANDDFKGKTYAGTPVEQLAPEFRAAVERNAAA